MSRIPVYRGGRAPAGRPVAGSGKDSAADQPQGASPRQRLFFIALILFSFSQWLLPGGSPDSAAGSPLANLLWVVAYLFAFANVLVEWDTAVRLMRASLPLIAILVLAGLSTFWSEEPVATVRRSLELVGTVALSLHLVCRLGLRPFIETLGHAIAIAAVASVIAVVLFPSFGISQDEATEGNWQGVFNHKNTLGLAMVLGMVTIACTFDPSKGIRRTGQIFILLVCLVLLVGSKNAGSYGTLVLLAVILPFLLWTRAKRLVTLAFSAIVVGAAAIGAMAMSGVGKDSVLGAVGKDATLSGRGDLWQLVTDAISRRPAGYGYGVFWGEGSPAGTLIYPYINWEPGSAHNGFLEVPLDLGILGELCLILLLALGLWRAWLSFWKGNDVPSAWPICAMLCVISGNLSEATFAMYNLLDWIVLVAAFLFATQACDRIHLAAVNGQNQMLRIPYDDKPTLSRYGG